MRPRIRWTRLWWKRPPAIIKADPIVHVDVRRPRPLDLVALALVPLVIVAPVAIAAAIAGLGLRDLGLLLAAFSPVAIAGTAATWASHRKAVLVGREGLYFLFPVGGVAIPFGLVQGVERTVMPSGILRGHVRAWDSGRKGVLIKLHQGRPIWISPRDPEAFVCWVEGLMHAADNRAVSEWWGPGSARRLLGQRVAGRS